MALNTWLAAAMQNVTFLGIGLDVILAAEGVFPDVGDAFVTIVQTAPR